MLSSLCTFKSNINRILVAWLHTGIGFKREKEMETKDEQGDWDEVPVDLWKEIGKRLVSRLDILRFRSVCKAWRTCVPSPTRFPLWVPQPPCDDQLLSSLLNGVPHFITERSFYMVDVGWVDSWPIRRVLMEFEEADQGGKFRRYAFGPSGFNIGLPEGSWMTPGPDHKLSFVGKAYLLRMALPRFDSLGKRVKGKWSFHETCMEVCKIVLISSNADSNYYAPVSELSVVALLASSQQLAVLRLGGSQDPHWDWDTGFCSDTFMDIATYKGQLCAVDFWGCTSVMDYNSLQMTRVADPLSIYPQVSGWKQLIEVEACGDLYLVVKPEGGYAKVYKLNLQLHKWVEVHDIGNQVFFRQESCSISIPADVLVAGNYERVMSKCKGKCRHFEPHSLVFADQHPHGDNPRYQSDRFCLLGLSMWGCTPRQKAPTSPSVVTTTSSILSQCDRSVIGRTNYQALADSLL